MAALLRTRRWMLGVAGRCAPALTGIASRSRSRLIARVRSALRSPRREVRMRNSDGMPQFYRACVVRVLLWLARPCAINPRHVTKGCGRLWLRCGQPWLRFGLAIPAH